MTSKIFMFGAPLALLAGALGGVPASAQNGDMAEYQRNRIAQLDQQVQRLGEGRTLTNSELQRLTNAVDGLREAYREFGRGGFTRDEIQRLDARIDSVRDRIATQTRDGDRLDGRRENRNNHR